MGIEDAVTTDAWTDEEAEALVIQPAKAFAPAAAAAAGGKGYTKIWIIILINSDTNSFKPNNMRDYTR